MKLIELLKEKHDLIKTYIGVLDKPNNYHERLAELTDSLEALGRHLKDFRLSTYNMSTNYLKSPQEARVALERLYFLEGENGVKGLGKKQHGWIFSPEYANELNGERLTTFVDRLEMESKLHDVKNHAYNLKAKWEMRQKAWDGLLNTLQHRLENDQNSYSENMLIGGARAYSQWIEFDESSVKNNKVLCVAKESLTKHQNLLLEEQDRKVVREWLRGR